MREFPLNRVVGKNKDAASDQRNVAELTKKRFQEQRFADIPHFADLPKWEREKTADEEAMCKIADKVTNRILGNFGVQPSITPLQNIHVLRNSEWGNLFNSEEEDARHDLPIQAFLIKEAPTRLAFAHIMVHEMNHAKLYGALQLLMPPMQKTIGVYRRGLYVLSRDGKKGRLKRMNEALTEELTVRARIELLRHPLFAREAEQTKLLKRRNPGVILTTGEPLGDSSNVWFARIVGRKAAATERYNFFDADGTPMIGRMNVEMSTYTDERRVLNLLIRKLFIRNKERFQSKEGVFRKFVEAAVTGNILPLRRLIDDTFGRGTFLKIANSDVEELDAKAGKWVRKPISELESVVSAL